MKFKRFHEQLQTLEKLVGIENNKTSRNSDDFEKSEILFVERLHALIAKIQESSTNPIFDAVESLDLEQLKLILKSNVNLNIYNLDRCTPLHIALQQFKKFENNINCSLQIQEYLECVRLLLNPGGVSGLFATTGNHGADPNMGSNDNVSALAYAVSLHIPEKFYMELIELLLTHGANPNAKTNYNFLVFTVPFASDATYLKPSNWVKMLNLFIKHGARVEMIDRANSCTILGYILGDDRKTKYPPETVDLVKLVFEQLEKTYPSFCESKLYSGYLLEVMQHGQNKVNLELVRLFMRYGIKPPSKLSRDAFPAAHSLLQLNHGLTNRKKCIFILLL